MKRRIASIIVAAVVFTMQLAAENSWNKIRYLAGTIQAKVNPYDYNTTLTISPGEIVLEFSPQPKVRLEPSRIVSLSYGKEAHERVAAVLQNVSAGPAHGSMPKAPPDPPGLFGYLRPKDHLIGIVFRKEDGSTGAVLLQTLPRHYSAILGALSMSTGKPIEIAK